MSVSLGWSLSLPAQASGPGGRLRHDVQRAYEALGKRCRAPLACGLSSPKAILSQLASPSCTQSATHSPPQESGCVQGPGRTLDKGTAHHPSIRAGDGHRTNGSGDGRDGIPNGHCQRLNCN